MSIYISPLALADYGATPVPGAYRVFAVPYPSAARPVREWRHRTLAAAARRMGSVASGKLRLRDDMSLFCVCPDGTIHSLNTARRVLKGA